MRKKWTYVAIVSMMLGVAPVFTGCVDTDEPAGLEDLRGAKATLLRAKAAVQEAKAKLVAAKEQYKLQEAAWMQAKADFAAQQAREYELRNDLLEAQTEYEKQKAEAAYQAYLEQLAREKEYLDKELEKSLLGLEEQIATSKLEIEKLRQQLELAKISGVEEVQTTITNLQTDVDNAYAELYGGTVNGKDVIGAVQELFNALKAQQEALIYQDNGFDCTVTRYEDGTYTVDASTGEKDWVATLEAMVEIAETERDAAEKLLNDLETYNDKEVEGTDWKAEVEAIQAEIDKLEEQLSIQKAQLSQAQATPEYLAALQAVEGVWEDAPESWTPDATKNKEGYDYKNVGTDSQPKYQLIVEKGASQILTDAKNALMKKQGEKLFAYDAYKAATEVTDEMKSAINAAITELNANRQPGQTPYVYPTNGFEYVAKKDIVWGTATDSKGNKIPSNVSKYPADLKTIANSYAQWITIVDAATIDPNEVAQAEAAMKRAQEEQKAANDAYEAAKKGWETLQGIIAEEKAYSVPTTKLTVSTGAYSTAFAQLDKAITDWNDAVDKAYQDAYDEAKAGWELELKVEAIRNGFVQNTEGAENFDEAEFYNQWDNKGSAYQTNDEFKRIVDQICDLNADPDDPTALSSAVWGAINLYVERGLLVPDNDPNKAAVLAAAKDAVTEGTADYFDAEGDYKMAITDAVTAVNNAVWKGTPVTGGDPIPSLKAAIAQFNVDAAAYVQLPADASKQAINVLIGIADKDGKFSGFTEESKSTYCTASKADEKTGKIKYTINVNNITAEEITDATKTKYNTAANAGHNALVAESKKVFGMDEARFVEPSRETIEAALAEHEGDAAYEAMYEASFAAKSFAADDKVAGLQNQIDASDDLDALHKELVAAQAAFKKSVEDQYAANFGELETAVTDATKDLAEKQKALDAEDAKHEDIEVEIAKLQAQINASEDLKDVLAEAAWEYLGITWPASTTEPTPGADEKYTQPSGNAYDPTQFAEDLQKAINQQKLVVANAEKAVQKAQADLQKAQAQGYNGVDQAQLYVNMASLKKANAEEAYAQALDKLQQAMEALAGTTEAE